MAEQVSGEPQAESDNTGGEGASYGVFKFLSLFGFIMGYFIVSGSVATLIYLDWIGLAPAIADATEPLPNAANGIIGVFAVFVNTVLLALLMKNSQSVVELSEEHGRF
ncbi:hypothetical protein CP556_24760 [Natrinema sp. CBA1119]|uniref:hypothetical protein n=1 Tax=Natrinema sp. CBA1119 TaxID=1608465 RepID=UPI000BF2D27E|nr:hypothetical protein [Natrinema sp. CBA1119]PGF14221.1 hypothetical protein CP556_24760 [Natrinema sp. CBA1119]